MGQIVGWSQGTGRIGGVLWTVDEAGQVTDLRNLGRLPGGSFSFAFGINNLGQVVGFADNAAGTRRPFIWTEDGGMQDLGVPDGLLGGEAHKINDQGQIVGAGYLGAFTDLTEEGRFVIWKVGTDGTVKEIQDLGTLGGQAAAAWNNNELGHVVGDIWRGGGQNGFFWSEEDGVLQIGGDEALGINDNDEVAGNGPLPGGGFVWTEAGGFTLIQDGVAMTINNSGQAAGRSRSSIGSHGFGQGFIWEGGELQLLPLPEDRDFSWAWAINDSGWIVGWGTDEPGNEFANLWIPNEQ